MTLRIAPDLLACLLAESKASPDREICGLMFGEDTTVHDAHPATNVAPDPATTFEIDPAALLAAHRAQRGGGPRLIGHYHSHPSGSAIPSACDAEAAEPGSLWLILAGGVARAWRAGEGGFTELPIRRRPLNRTAPTARKRHPVAGESMTDRMDDAALDFASLLCSRLCHDLLNPVGAIGNGLELLVDERDPGLRGQYMDLLADSVAVAQARLKYYRLAFGAAGSFGETLAAAEVRTLIDALVRAHGKLAFGWMADDSELPRGAIRILLNLTLIALDSLVRGGRLDIALEADEIVVRAEGPRLVLDAEVRAALEGALDTPSSRSSGAWLARALATREGRDLLVAFDPELLVLGVGSSKVTA